MAIEGTLFDDGLQFDCFNNKQTPDQIRAKLTTMVQSGIISPEIARAIISTNGKEAKPLTVETMIATLMAMDLKAKKDKNAKAEADASQALKAIGALSPARKIKLEE
jgi:hypothetical protein